MSNLCQYFSTVGKLLLESRVLTEASDVLNNPKIANHPGGRDVVMTAHVSPFVKFNAYNIVLGHNQEFTPVKLGNVRWSAMRNVWILLFAERGTALVYIKYIDRSGGYNIYYVLTSNGQSTNTDKFTSSAELSKYIRTNLGTISTNALVSPNDIGGRKRKQRISAATKQEINNTRKLKDLMMKFSPLYVRLLKKAYADLKGQFMTAVQNDYVKIANFNRLKNLKKVISSLEDYDKDSIANMFLYNDENPLRIYIENATLMAITMTAGYYFPEQTGEIDRYHRAESSEGMKLVLDKLNSNDTDTLSMFLYFLKQCLVGSSTEPMWHFKGLL